MTPALPQPGASDGAGARRGPLAHLTVVEFAGLGPAPFAGMLLADHGARVIRIDRPARPGKASGMAALTARNSDVLSRGRESIALDLKRAEGRDVALRLIAAADVLIEGFRPGVMESLGLGPEVCLERRSSLVYGRVTGWGQTGPLAQAAGHDINYTALSGALHSTARRNQPPTPTPGLIGDFGGGGMLAAFGLLAAVLHARLTGQGQVVDVAISDGAALLTSLIQGWHSAGLWNAEAGTNNGDGGAHFYDVYACADGKYVTVGAMEPQFYALLRDKCGWVDEAFDAQWDPARWPALKDQVATVFARKTREEWCEILEGTDACFAPVLNLDEAPLHPHNQARGTFVKVNGITQPAPAPRFGAGPAPVCQPVRPAGADTRALLLELGYAPAAIDGLLDGVAQQTA
jgi:alpha-methylacyl-CoA racemase